MTLPTENPSGRRYVEAPRVHSCNILEGTSGRSIAIGDLYRCGVCGQWYESHGLLGWVPISDRQARRLERRYARKKRRP